MRLALIGGHGHHYVRQGFKEPNHPIEFPIAFASDGVDESQAKRFADAMDVPTIWFADRRAMYESFRPELVSVGAVYAHNGDLAAEALERGVPTISDKPVACSMDQLLRLQQITSKPDCPPLITEYDFRARKDWAAAREAFAAGEIGQMVMIVVQKTYRFGTRPAWYGLRDQYGGTLMWVLSHALDYIVHCSGEMFTTLTGHGGNIARCELAEFDDHVAVLGELENGATAVAYADMIRPEKSSTHGDDRLRIIGSKGLIEIIDGRCTITTHEASARVLVEGATKQGVGQALLDAAAGRDASTFSTDASMQSATLMLKAREAVDRSKWVDL